MAFEPTIDLQSQTQARITNKMDKCFVGAGECLYLVRIKLDIVFFKGYIFLQVVKCLGFLTILVTDSSKLKPVHIAVVQRPPIPQSCWRI